MIEIKIFNVNHGFCAAINTGEHHTMLIDSGYNSHTGFQPSQYLIQQNCKILDCFVIPAYGDDHLEHTSDLIKECLIYGLPINFAVINPSIDPGRFPGLDAARQRVGNVLKFSANWHPECQKVSEIMTIHDVNVAFFWNNYPDFKDAHNLSLVTFVSYRDINIIFPGDLELQGWQELLKCDDFRYRLKRVNLFVASDHGREDGYCPEVFDYCRPELIIVSNTSNQPLSPFMMQQYNKHAKGAPDGICNKKVLTTYEDGNITISKYLDRLRQINTQQKVFQ